MDRFLYNNTVLRILALVLACAIWLGVNAPGGTQTLKLSQPYAFSIKVDAPAGMMATTVQPSYATVIVSGDAASLAMIQAAMAHVTVVADATGLGVGSHVVHLKVSGMPMIAHTLDPQTVTVVLKAMETIRVPIDVVVVGRHQAGYMYGNPQFSGRAASVSGSTAQTKRVVGLRADVSVRGRSATFTENASLVPVDHLGHRVHGVSVTPPTISVTVPITSPTTATAALAQVVGNPAPGFAIDGVLLSPSRVTVYGLPPTVKPGQSGPVTVVPVPVAGLRATTTEHLAVPVSPGETKVTPTTVSAKVDVVPSETRTLSDVPIQVTDVSSGERVVLAGPNTLSLSLFGPKNVIDTLTISDVDAYIDAANLTPNRKSAIINITVPPWVQVTQMSTAHVAVQVTVS